MMAAEYDVAGFDSDELILLIQAMESSEMHLEYPYLWDKLREALGRLQLLAELQGFEE